MHVVLFYAIRKKGPTEPVGAKTGHDFVCCDTKEGDSGSL